LGQDISYLPLNVIKAKHFCYLNILQAIINVSLVQSYVI